MNFDDIELRLRYPHVFRDQKYASYPSHEKSASVLNNLKWRKPGLNWLRTLFRHIRQIED